MVPRFSGNDPEAASFPKCCAVVTTVTYPGAKRQSGQGMPDK